MSTARTPIYPRNLPIPTQPEDDGEFPDSYLDRIDGHWYVITYVWNGPQIHALDCTTCLEESDQ